MNFLIKYTVYSNRGSEIKSGKIRVKNKMSSMHAQFELEKYLKKKHVNFAKLVVHDCVEDNPINDLFGDIFGQKIF
jgi:hypothetical protein